MDDKNLENRIRDRAYDLYIEAGQPQGKDHEFRAQREIAGGGETEKNGQKVEGLANPTGT